MLICILSYYMKVYVIPQWLALVLISFLVIDVKNRVKLEVNKFSEFNEDK